MGPAEQPDLRRLIGTGVVMVQPFLTAASLDLSAKICVVAFSVAIPLLAALALVNRQEAFRRRRTRSVLVSITQVVAETCASAGVVAGFWHILWIAGVGMLASGLVAVAVHSAGYVRLERDQEATPQNPATSGHSSAGLPDGCTSGHTPLPATGARTTDIVIHG